MPNWAGIGVAALLGFASSGATVSAQGNLGPFSVQSQFPTAQVFQAILVLNQERLLRLSKTGKALLATETEMRSAHQSEGIAMDVALENEERSIADIRDKTPGEAFEEMAEAFDKKVVQARLDHQKRSVALGEEIEERRKKFFADLVPIVAEIMKERGAALVFEQRNVLFTGPNVDITPEVITRMDREAGFE